MDIKMDTKYCCTPHDFRSSEHRPLLAVWSTHSSHSKKNTLKLDLFANGGYENPGVPLIIQRKVVVRRDTTDPKERQLGRTRGLKTQELKNDKKEKR